MHACVEFGLSSDVFVGLDLFLECLYHQNSQEVKTKSEGEGPDEVLPALADLLYCVSDFSFCGRLANAQGALNKSEPAWRLPVMNTFRNQAQQVQAVALTKHFWSSFSWGSLQKDVERLHVEQS